MCKQEAGADPGISNAGGVGGGGVQCVHPKLEIPSGWGHIITLCPLMLSEAYFEAF